VRGGGYAPTDPTGLSGDRLHPRALPSLSHNLLKSPPLQRACRLRWATKRDSERRQSDTRERSRSESLSVRSGDAVFYAGIRWSGIDADRLEDVQA
jgi:hypothetical protein